MSLTSGAWKGLFLDQETINELMEDAEADGLDPYYYLDDFYTGGNAGHYLSSHNVFVREVKRGEV